MCSFNEGDRVAFQGTDGRMRKGTVTRLNKKTISVATDDEHHWKVSPSLLRLIEAEEDDE